MRNRVIWFVLFVTLAFSAAAQDVPPRPSRLLTDKAGVLKATDVDELEQTLARMPRAGLGHVIVYIDRALPPAADFEAYTKRMTNTWGVGSAEKNDGVVLFIFIADRKMRIEVGLGLEDVLTDDLAKNIMDNELRPAFLDERYAVGLSRAIDSIARTLDMGRAAKKKAA